MKDLVEKYKQKIKSLTTTHKSSDILNIVLCAMIMIFFFASMFFTSNGGFSENEKRDLASFPKLSEMSLKEFFQGKYFSQINDFYQDNFVKREQFLSLSDKIDKFKGLESEIKMTTVQNTSTVDASIKNNKDNEEDEDLYTSAEQVGSLLSIDNVVCEAYGFNEAVVEQYAETIKNFGDTLTNCNVYNILIPTHVEFALPSKYENLSAKQKPAIDLVYNKNGDNVKSVDAYSELKKHKKEYIYFKSDHHWTQLGAYYAYTAYCKEAKLNAFKLNDFKSKKIEGFLGTLYAASKEEKLLENPDYVEYRSVGENLNTTIYTKGDLSSSYECTPYAEFCEGSNSYGVFIYGDNPLTVIKNPEIKENKKVVVVKESYGNAFAPLLTQNYSEVYVLDMRYFKKSFKTFIEENQIEDVIFINNMMAVGAQVRVDELKILLNN